MEKEKSIIMEKILIIILSFLMLKYLREIIYMTKEMEKELNIMIMVIDMKEIGEMVKEKEKELFGVLT